MLIHAPEVIARHRAQGWWGDTRLQDLLAQHAARAPAQECLVDPPNLAAITGEAPQRLTWSALQNLVDRLACALLDRLGARHACATGPFAGWRPV